MELEKRIKSALLNYANVCIFETDIKKIIDKIFVELKLENNKENKLRICNYLSPIVESDRYYCFKLHDEPKTKYEYSVQGYRISKKLYEPVGTQWIHDDQVDDVDVNTDLTLQRTNIFNALKELFMPAQCSPEWFKMRENKITASDIGAILGMNKYSSVYEIILKKVTGSEFVPNKYCYHGKKYEQIANMLYEYRRNVKIESFGLIEHPQYSFIGASPDGICSTYKADGKHLSKYVGRMIEIKCPITRTIQMDGPIFDGICPQYYWAQIQIQLECCNLEECDFWQCNITEYPNRNAFIEDTDANEYFRSKETGYEKGCVIQLLPLYGRSNLSFMDNIYSNAVFIYPPKIEMSPQDIDIWCIDTLNNIRKTHPRYYFDTIFYWRLNVSHNVTITRDKEWFQTKLPRIEQINKYILFLKQNPDIMRKWKEYIETLNIKRNDKIINFLELLYQSSSEKK
jgi:putative phage-type endonuclease